MEKATRFRVINGEAQPKAPKATIRQSSGARFSLEKFECVPCSAQLGYSFGNLIEARVGAHVISGELVGGALFWVCQKCSRPHFHIKDFPVTK